MGQPNQKSILVHREKYRHISRLKQEFEELTGQHLDWGTFLLIGLGLRTLQEAEKQKDLTVVQKEGEAPLELEKGMEELRFPATLDGEERERIAERVVAKLREEVDAK